MMGKLRPLHSAGLIMAILLLGCKTLEDSALGQEISKNTKSIPKLPKNPAVKELVALKNTYALKTKELPKDSLLTVLRSTNEVVLDSAKAGVLLDIYQGNADTTGIANVMTGTKRFNKPLSYNFDITVGDEVFYTFNYISGAQTLKLELFENNALRFKTDNFKRNKTFSGTFIVQNSGQLVANVKSKSIRKGYVKIHLAKINKRLKLDKVRQIVTDSVLTMVTQNDTLLKIFVPKKINLKAGIDITGEPAAYHEQRADQNLRYRLGWVYWFGDNEAYQRFTDLQEPLLGFALNELGNGTSYGVLPSFDNGNVSCELSLGQTDVKGDLSLNSKWNYGLVATNSQADLRFQFNNQSRLSSYNLQVLVGEVYYEQVRREVVVPVKKYRTTYRLRIE